MALLASPVFTLQEVQVEEFSCRLQEIQLKNLLPMGKDERRVEGNQPNGDSRKT
jgi:hypothetical protein